VLIPRSAAVSLRDPFIESMIQSIFEASAQQGYFAMLAMLTADREPDFYHRILRSRHFDGVIMFSSDIDDPILPLLSKDGGPMVLIGRHPYFLNVTWVDVENREGAREAVAHLIGLGHRRIGVINGQLQMEAAQARRDGYKQALLEAGIGIDNDLMVEGFFSEAAAYQAMSKLLDLYQPPTAIFTASDTMAIGALHAIADRGLRVPDDVALIGYDDLPLAANATPSLTSVHQPIGEMGAHAVRVLIEQIREQGPATSVRLSAHLVVRESCGGGAALARAKGGSVLTRGAPTLAG
jgi:LacI family transcriptional regulator